ncbi:MAG: hypothetical protein Q9164_004528 [Protoblastenia rupestris]
MHPPSSFSRDHSRGGFSKQEEEAAKPETTVERDLYEVLGISRGCKAVEIKKAYQYDLPFLFLLAFQGYTDSSIRKLSLLHHPDKNQGDPTATARFQEISAAYDVLKDLEKRAEYNLKRLPGKDAQAADDMHGKGMSKNFGFGGEAPEFVNERHPRRSSYSGYPKSSCEGHGHHDKENSQRDKEHGHHDKGHGHPRSHRRHEREDNGRHRRGRH